MSDEQEKQVAGTAPAVRQRTAGTKRTSQHPSQVDKTKNPFTAYMRGDRLKLEDMDGDYEFRWCNRHDLDGIARREALGFKRVTKGLGLNVKNLGTPRLQEGEKSETGVIEEGDLVLMCLPKDLAEMRRQAVTEYNADIMSTMTEEVQGQMKGAGMPLHGGVKIEI